MTRPQPPLFLARRSYRRRRIRDGARILPLFGVFLFALPILWSPAGTEAQDTAPDAIYLFCVWAALIVAAALMAPRLADSSADAPASAEDEV